MPASLTSRPRSAWFSFPAPKTLLANRRRVAEIYNAHLAEHPLLKPPYVPEGLEPNWQSYQVMVREGLPLYPQRDHGPPVSSRRSHAARGHGLAS